MSKQAPDRSAPRRGLRAAISGVLRRLARKIGKDDDHQQLVALLHQVLAEGQRQEKKWRAIFKDQLAAQQQEVLRLVQQIAVHQQQELKWRTIFRDQLNAVLRRQVMQGSDITQPFWLTAQRFRLRSQNEEDGVTLALLDAAGVTARRFVEIGSGSSGGNSAVLAFDFGWSGLMVEASETKASRLRRKIAFNPAVKVLQAFVTAENINALLTGNGMTGEVDLLSIDVDSTDYWLLDALRACSPRVLIIEYNALFGADRAVTLPATNLPEQPPKGYFGASLAALEKKARERGYRLVYCDTVGVNAFFLRHDVAPGIAGLPPATAYRPLLERADLDGAERTTDVYDLIRTHGLPIVEV